MKKNIIIIILIVIAVFTILYAFIKADEAKKAGMEASLSQQEVERMRDEAIVLQQAAEESAAEAKRQEAMSLDLMEELKTCKNK